MFSLSCLRVIGKVSSGFSLEWSEFWEIKKNISLRSACVIYKTFSALQILLKDCLLVIMECPDFD